MLCCLDFPTHFPIRLSKLFENITGKHMHYILKKYSKQITHKENKPKGWSNSKGDLGWCYWRGKREELGVKNTITWVCIIDVMQKVPQLRRSYAR